VFRLGSLDQRKVAQPPTRFLRVLRSKLRRYVLLILPQGPIVQGREPMRPIHLVISVGIFSVHFGRKLNSLARWRKRVQHGAYSARVLPPTGIELKKSSRRSPTWRVAICLRGFRPRFNKTDREYITITRNSFVKNGSNYALDPGQESGPESLGPEHYLE